MNLISNNHFSWLLNQLPWLIDQLPWLVGILTLFLMTGLRFLVRTDIGETIFEESPNSNTLVVIIHGLSGRSALLEVETLAREVYINSDFLFSTYKPCLLCNIDTYRLTNLIEQKIHSLHSANQYERIVLIGYSMGPILLRKALVWGHGYEEDRISPQGQRKWVDKVERFVSIAGVNRGIAFDFNNKNLPFYRWLYAYLLEKFARLTGTGKMVLSLWRGAPFIGDLRIQWIRMARNPNKENNLPLTIHVFGDVDDSVSYADCRDIACAKDTKFITIENTNHINILSDLYSKNNKNQLTTRGRKIKNAFVQPMDMLEVDHFPSFKEDETINRIIYILHGIRDYGKWTDDLRNALEENARHRDLDIAIVPPKYGYFPLGPFLLYRDRQKNVRKFMDEFTENFARFPQADKFDFIGHSNGTYILVSALKHYKTLKVGRVFFAGSVAPKYYKWKALIDSGRVDRVINVMANSDWVVAWFPRLFEQLAEWIGINQESGIFDIGSAGFRGFDDASDANRRIQNRCFVEGQHSAGINIHNSSILEAISNYIVSGDEDSLTVFQQLQCENRCIGFFSNICWAIWILLAGTLISIGYFALIEGGRYGIIGYTILLLLLLNSI